MLNSRFLIQLPQKAVFFYSVLLFSLPFIYVGCSKTETVNTANSSIHLLSDQSKIEIQDLRATSDGGFLVSYHTRANGNQELRLVKYNADLEVIWEYLTGADYDYEFKQLFIDRDENILVAGLFLGLDQDLIEAGNLPSWSPYLVLISKDGDVIWEKELSYYPRYTNDTRINYVGQDDLGNYIIAGRFSLNPNVYVTSLLSAHVMGAVKLVNSTGQEIGNTMLTAVNKVHDVLAMYDRGNDYLILTHMPNSGQVIYGSIDKSKFTGINKFQIMDSVPWPFNEIRAFDLKSVVFVDQESENEYQYYFSESNVLKMGWHHTNSNIIYKDYGSGAISSNYSWFGDVRDEYFYAVDGMGQLTRLDMEFNELKKISVNYDIQMGCQLTEGNYIGLLQSEKEVLLMKFDSNGKIID